MAANRPIIVKKVKKVAGGHHGGAWKVAYADFVTAMMAFFLLMWLINTTSPEQKRGIADYFAPASLSASTSGSGGLLAGTALGESGAMQQGSTPMITESAPPQEAASADGKGAGGSMSAEDIAQAQKETADFEAAELSIRQALQDLPELSELSRNIIVDQTPEGLRIQLVDQEGRPMFGPGSADPNEAAKILLKAAARVTLQLPNQIIISGHTDAAPNPDGVNSNWELSAARANSARKILMQAGLPEDRIAQIVGKAGFDPLFADDPFAPANRRIAIILKRSAPPLPTNGSL